MKRTCHEFCANELIQRYQIPFIWLNAKLADHDSIARQSIYTVLPELISLKVRFALVFRTMAGVSPTDYVREVKLE